MRWMALTIGVGAILCLGCVSVMCSSGSALALFGGVLLLLCEVWVKDVGFRC